MLIHKSSSPCTLQMANRIHARRGGVTGRGRRSYAVKNWTNSLTIELQRHQSIFPQTVITSEEMAVGQNTLSRTSTSHTSSRCEIAHRRHACNPAAFRRTAKGPSVFVPHLLYAANAVEIRVPGPRPPKLRDHQTLRLQSLWSPRARGILSPEPLKNGDVAAPSRGGAYVLIASVHIRL